MPLPANLKCAAISAAGLAVALMLGGTSVAADRTTGSAQSALPCPALRSAPHTKPVVVAFTSPATLPYRKFLDAADRKLWFSETSRDGEHSTLFSLQANGTHRRTVRSANARVGWLADKHRAWFSVTNGLEVSRTATGKVIRSWTQQQLSRSGGTSWLSPDSVVGTTSHVYVSGFHYPSGDATSVRGRFAVTSLVPGHERPLWSTVLTDHSRSTVGRDLAVGPSGVYLFIPADPQPGRFMVVRFDRRTGQVLDRRSVSAGNRTGQPEQISVDAHGVYVSVFRDTQHGSHDRLERLSPTTLAVRAHRDLPFVSGWVDEPHRGLAVLGQSCGTNSVVWRLNPKTLRSSHGPRGLPGQTLQTFLAEGRASYLIDRNDGVVLTYHLR